MMPSRIWQATSTDLERAQDPEENKNGTSHLSPLQKGVG
jgi:hypothetical protein